MFPDKICHRISPLAWCSKKWKQLWIRIPASLSWNGILRLHKRGRKKNLKRTEQKNFGVWYPKYNSGNFHFRTVCQRFPDWVAFFQSRKFLVVSLRGQEVIFDSENSSNIDSKRKTRCSPLCNFFVQVALGELKQNAEKRREKSPDLKIILKEVLAALGSCGA